MSEENKAEPMTAKEAAVYWSNKWESSMVENDRLRLELATLKERIKDAPCECSPAAPTECSICELRASALSPLGLNAPSGSIPSEKPGWRSTPGECDCAERIAEAKADAAEARADREQDR